MRYLLLSDVHGNLHALESVLNHAKKKGYDSILFLGDAIGYGAFPDECVEILKDISSEFLRGNHDSVIVNVSLLEFMNPYAKEAVVWSIEQLSEENRNFLAHCPVKQRLNRDVLLVHSSPNQPEEWFYIFGSEDAQHEFTSFDEWICAFGHTHVPIVFLKRSNSSDVSVSQPGITLSRESKYLINPGSVGQPRDGNPLASYGILDFERKTFEVFRVEYPVEEAHNAILNAGLPEILAYRLLEGY